MYVVGLVVKMPAAAFTIWEIIVEAVQEDQHSMNVCLLQSRPCAWNSNFYKLMTRPE